ncbi:MAG TPA: hypothetical protein VFL80_12035, partial [Thermoanaerobaculia bacterium]|nr:hypothetical protein [Thermoanaerobaculia bacterium]
ASCEREVLQQFGSHIGCDSPIAVHATSSNGQATVRAFVSRPDGTGAIRVTRSGSSGTVAAGVGRELIAGGALEMLA